MSSQIYLVESTLNLVLNFTSIVLKFLGESSTPDLISKMALVKNSWKSKVPSAVCYGKPRLKSSRLSPVTLRARTLTFSPIC